jgi:hypothetical protein
MRKFSFGGLLAVVALAPTYSLADTVTPGDGAVCASSCILTSAPPTIVDSYVDFTLSSPVTFGSISSLSANFTDTAGGADAGSPRFALSATNGDFFLVYLGTPPNFNDSNPVTFTTAFSGTNLNNGTNNSAFENGNTYVTLASLEAAYGTDVISDAFFILERGYAANGPQSLTLNSIDINGTDIPVSATPVPAALPMFAGGLGFVGWLMRRKKRTANNLAAA